MERAIFQISAEEAQQCRQALDRLAAIDWQPTFDKIQQAQRAWSNLPTADWRGVQQAFEGVGDAGRRALDQLQQAQRAWNNLPTIDLRGLLQPLDDFASTDWQEVRYPSIPSIMPRLWEMDIAIPEHLGRQKGGRPKGRTSTTDAMAVETAQRFIAGEKSLTRAAIATLKHRGVKGDLKSKADHLVKVLKKRF